MRVIKLKFKKKIITCDVIGCTTIIKSWQSYYCVQDNNKTRIVCKEHFDHHIKYEKYLDEKTNH